MTNHAPAPVAGEGARDVQIVLAIGTRKGLFLARTDASRPNGWRVEGPEFLMREVPSVAFDRTGGTGLPRLLVGVRSEHWGPTVARSDDLGATWQETEHGSIVFPEGTGAALERIWQLQPDRARPGVVWAGCEPTSLWRSTDGGEHFELIRGLWDHPHRPDWWPGFGGAAVHTIVTDPGDDQRVLLVALGGVEWDACQVEDIEGVCIDLVVSMYLKFEANHFCGLRDITFAHWE